MKKLVYSLIAALLLFAVVASAHMKYYGGRYGMMAAGASGMVCGLIYFAIGAFVFSVIFWWVHNWMTKKK